MAWDKIFMLLFHKQFWLLKVTVLWEKKPKEIPLQPQQGCSEASPLSPLETFTELPPNHHTNRSLRSCGNVPESVLHLGHTPSDCRAPLSVYTDNYFKCMRREEKWSLDDRFLHQPWPIIFLLDISEGFSFISFLDYTIAIWYLCKPGSSGDVWSVINNA